MVVPKNPREPKNREGLRVLDSRGIRVRISRFEERRRGQEGREREAQICTLETKGRGFIGRTCNLCSGPN